MTHASRRHRTSWVFLLLLAAALATTITCRRTEQTESIATPWVASLTIAVVDEATGEKTPARIEVLDAEKKPWIAKDALTIWDEIVPRNGPPDAPEKRRMILKSNVHNKFRGAEQFYSTGTSDMELPVGKYCIRVEKGIEYLPVDQEMEIKEGGHYRKTISLKRWANEPARKWYSGDVHVHIDRTSKDLDMPISKWMQAEDIHVANLLQMGESKHFFEYSQYDYGKKGEYREGDYLLSSGQENPRTHILGHTIIIGAESAINFPNEYLIYHRFFEEAAQRGGISGYAHYGKNMNAQTGVAVDIHSGLVSFIEVFQFGKGVYDVWYDALNMGYRIAPAAGTDYPFSGTMPGREYTYANVEGDLTVKAWIDAIRHGKTFVTNGLLLEFQINGQSIGDEIQLKEPGAVHVQGKARFNPLRDEVQALELVENSDVVKTFPRQDSSSTEIAVSFDYDVKQTAWLALRAQGRRLGEKCPTASAHTAAIYVTIKNSPSLADQPKAKAIAQAWCGRVAALERSLEENEGRSLAKWPSSNLDGVDEAYLLSNQKMLLDTVKRAMEQYE
ncbi:MAG: CehA/McbA family metallohydrolase [Candidatus Sumerlaeota bacterium]|nr:CehA/McbA family metallohydrolase [Candidatus Sumerlaeota bacterium]